MAHLPLWILYQLFFIQVSKQGKVNYPITYILCVMNAPNLIIPYLKVCVAELGRLWSSDITLKQILSQIYGLLLEPDLDNPLEIQASLKYC